MSFIESFVQIDGCRTRLLRGGQGTPLLYLHGANGVAGIQPFMLKLAERFDVWIPEHPGFGQSDEPEWLENIHDLAYFYLDFMREHQLTGAHVLGSSLGGWLAKGSFVVLFFALLQMLVPGVSAISRFRRVRKTFRSWWTSRSWM